MLKRSLEDFGQILLKYVKLALLALQAESAHYSCQGPCGEAMSHYPALV